MSFAHIQLGTLRKHLLKKPILSKKRSIDNWKYFHEIEYYKEVEQSHIDGVEYICCNISGDCVDEISHMLDNVYCTDQQRLLLNQTILDNPNPIPLLPSSLLQQ